MRDIGRTVMVIGCVLRDLVFSADEMVLPGQDKQVKRVERVVGDGVAG